MLDQLTRSLRAREADLAAAQQHVKALQDNAGAIDKEASEVRMHCEKLRLQEVGLGSAIVQAADEKKEVWHWGSLPFMTGGLEGM